MAADFIGRDGLHYKMYHSDLLNLQDVAKLAGIYIETDIEYTSEQAKELYEKLNEYKDEIIGVRDNGDTVTLKGFLKFLKKCKGFILY